ncbi:MAG TPA: nitroreductase family protein [Methanobacterium sp.]|nr:nitroreductase family protein [Methanobacterium sp.]
MELSEAIMNRRSIRKFKEKVPEDELIEKIVEAGIWAPSAGDLQSWDAVVVKDDQIKVQIAVAAYVQEFVAKAPVLIIICANTANAGARYGERGRELYCIQDASCAALNMMLRAHDLGLGSAWVGAFKEEDVTDLLELPAHVRPVAIIPIGYADEEPEAPPRRNIADVIHNEKY